MFEDAMAEPVTTAELETLLARLTLPLPSGPSGRIERITACEQVKNALSAVQARETAAFAEQRQLQQEAAGLSPRRLGLGLAGEIGLARRESPRRGGIFLALARTLVDEMPATLAAVQSGAASEWKAILMARESAVVSLADRRVIDAALGPQLGRLSARQVEGSARAMAQRLDAAAAARRASRAERDRRVTLRPAPDTMAWLGALLPVRDGVAVYAALEREARRLIAEGDPRTRAQIMADVLIARVTGRSSADGQPIEVHVVISDQALVGEDDTPGYVPGFGTVPADIIRSWIIAAFTDDENPTPAKPTPGQPAAGEPTTGQPAEGAPGQPTAGETATGQPAEGARTSRAAANDAAETGTDTAAVAGDTDHPGAADAAAAGADHLAVADADHPAVAGADHPAAADAGDTDHPGAADAAAADAGDTAAADAVADADHPAVADADHPAVADADHPAAGDIDHPAAAVAGDTDHPGAADAGDTDHPGTGDGAAGLRPFGAARERDLVRFRRLWTGPDGRDLVAMDSRSRYFRGLLRAMIRLRDQTCATPWCDAPIRHIDHIIRYADNGPTSYHFGRGECVTCNLAREAPGWQVEVTSKPGQTHQVTVTTPTGHRYTHTAPPLLPGRWRAPTPPAPPGDPPPGIAHAG